MRKLLRALGRDTSVIGRATKKFLGKLPFLTASLSLEDRLIIGNFRRIHYAYCVARAADLAARLGYQEVTVIEFGVAGGNGLVALEEIKEIVERSIPINIRIVGFDAGSGLPSPVDYRDLPYHWQGGFFQMDVPRLKKRLKYATLEIGPVSDTLPAFISRTHNAPIGAISFDLDFYSSTVEAFRIFDLAPDAILPRVMCYMDDIAGTEEMISDFTGERLAIAEFNSQHEMKKLSPCYDFEAFPIERWQQRVFIHHDFEHPRYNTFVGRPGDDQLPIL